MKQVAAEMQISDVRENWSIIVWCITAVAGAVAAVYKWFSNSRLKSEKRLIENQLEISRAHTEILQVKADLLSLTKSHTAHVQSVTAMEATMAQMALGVARIEGAMGIIVAEHHQHDIDHGQGHGHGQAK